LQLDTSSPDPYKYTFARARDIFCNPNTDAHRYTIGHNHGAPSIKYAFAIPDRQPLADSHRVSRPARLGDLRNQTSAFGDNVQLGW
jgi:hypothetical protein